MKKKTFHFFFGSAAIDRVIQNSFCVENVFSLTLELINSHAISFSDFRVIALQAQVTVSRRFPNWNKNVISGPSMVTRVMMKLRNTLALSFK